MNSNPAANSYLKTKILTASPQELRLMLYEGAIKFCHQARKAIEDSNIEESFNHLMQAQKIVLELSSSLNHDVAPELCEKLNALYTFIYRLLVDANIEKRVDPIDEALKLLEYEKQTWHMLMNKAAGEDHTRPGGDQVHVANAQQTAISSLSVNG